MSAGACALMTAGVMTVLLGSAPGAAPQPTRDAVVHDIGAGSLLVAARHLPDPNFADTVVLLIEHSAEGAAGLVLNRRSAVPLARVLPGVAAGTGLASTAFIGGPVSRTTVLALSRTPCDACPLVIRGVHLVRTADALTARLAEGADEGRVRVYAGYAGWGPGQLEAEARQGAWRVLGADAPAVFDPDPDSLWRRLITRTEAVLAGWPQRTPRLAEATAAS